VIAPSLTGKVGRQLHENTPPSGGCGAFLARAPAACRAKCGWAFDIANLPGRLDVTRPVCADAALAASMRRIRRPERGSLEGSRGECPLQGPVLTQSGACGRVSVRDSI
jgi:hypothetical protein